MESTQLMVSVSGIRGIVGQGLGPEVALNYADALAHHVNGGTIVVSRDSRPSGAVLEQAVLAGLLSAGCNVIRLGIAPTPTCGRAVRLLGAAGGIQITASHNPSPWNGLKLFGSDGAVLTAAEGLAIQRLYEGGGRRRVAWDHLGSVKDTNAAEEHLDAVLNVVDPEPVRARRPRVLIDANGGAGGPLAQRLLERLGADVIAHQIEPNGQFTHEPEPVPENLTGLRRFILESRADLGFVLDPDADRLAILDDRGESIGEELSLALAAQVRLGQQPGPVVCNMSTSRVLEDVAHQAGVPFHRTAVGEANVVAGMRQHHAVIGGEGNGGVIDPRIGWVRDPFIGMALILCDLAATGQSLRDRVAALPHYEIVKTKCTVDRASLDVAWAGLRARWPEAWINDTDGLRLDWADRWLHVRPSNTEPIVRIIAEAPTRVIAESICDEARQVLERR